MADSCSSPKASLTHPSPFLHRVSGLVLLQIVLLLFSTNAHATGSWVVTLNATGSVHFSGTYFDYYTQDWDTYSQTLPLDIPGDGSGIYIQGEFPWNAETLNYTGYEDNVSFTATIDVLMKWEDPQGSSPAPENVIVEEYSLCNWVSFGSASSYSISGNANNGLSSPYIHQSNTSSNGESRTESGVCETVAKPYTLKHPDSNGEIHYTVSMSGNIDLDGFTTAPNMPDLPVEAFLWGFYQAVPHSVYINLDGGIGDRGAKRYLIGQKLNATLHTDGLQATSHNWAVSSGGDPFDGWNPDRNLSVMPLTVIGSNTAVLECYFKKPVAVQTVSCVAHIATPPGGIPASGIDVTTSEEFSVEKPSNSLSAVAGDVQGFPITTPDRMLYTGASVTVDSITYTSGILWIGSVETPTDFVSSTTPGGWNYTQLITGHRVIHTPGVTHNWYNNGIQMLDSTFGYEPVMPDVYPDTDVVQVEGDSPEQPLYDVADYVEVLDNFITYTLYVPPGIDSVFVPLKNLEWFWEGEAAVFSPPHWTVYNTADGWSFLYDFPAFPTWTANVADELNTWVPPLPPSP